MRVLPLIKSFKYWFLCSFSFSFSIASVTTSLSSALSKKVPAYFKMSSGLSSRILRINKAISPFNSGCWRKYNSFCMRNSSYKGKKQIASVTTLLVQALDHLPFSFRFHFSELQWYLKHRSSRGCWWKHFRPLHLPPLLPRHPPQRLKLLFPLISLPQLLLSWAGLAVALRWWWLALLELQTSFS